MNHQRKAEYARQRRGRAMDRHIAHGDGRAQRWARAWSDLERYHQARIDPAPIEPSM